MQRTAVFPGTFNPFTLGHLSIVERGLGIFDRVVVAVGRNIGKPEGEARRRAEEIARIFRDSPRVEVAVYEGLTADFVRSVGACAILRGVRGVTDFEYERNLADVNKKILGVDTVFLISLPEYAFISSSMARELAANGRDVSALLPGGAGTAAGAISRKFDIV